MQLAQTLLDSCLTLTYPRIMSLPHQPQQQPQPQQHLDVTLQSAYPQQQQQAAADGWDSDSDSSASVSPDTDDRTIGSDDDNDNSSGAADAVDRLAWVRACVSVVAKVAAVFPRDVLQMLAVRLVSVVAAFDASSGAFILHLSLFTCCVV